MSDGKTPVCMTHGVRMNLCSKEHAKTPTALEMLRDHDSLRVAIASHGWASVHSRLNEIARALEREQAAREERDATVRFTLKALRDGQYMTTAKGVDAALALLDGAK